MSKYELYLNDILRAVKLIESSTKNVSFDKFKSDRELIDATAMRLQIIGESLNKLPKKMLNNNSSVDWEAFQRLRNLISHAYFKVNPIILFSIIKDKLFYLKKEIKLTLGKK